MKFKVGDIVCDGSGDRYLITGIHKINNGLPTDYLQFHLKDLSTGLGKTLSEKWINMKYTLDTSTKILKVLEEL